MEEVKKEEYIKPICQQCKSKQVYVTLKQKICRKCGYREELKKEVANEIGSQATGN